MILHQAIKIMI